MLLRQSLHAHSFTRPTARAIAVPFCLRLKSTTTTTTPPVCSFAFDIDGVLLKSSKPIPGATDALALLKTHAIPFILLTNGGGLSERARVTNLSRHLATEIDVSQFIQSHTPFRHHAQHYPYKNVFVCGGIGDACRSVAQEYGFPHVTLPCDLLAADESAWPYHTLTTEERACSRPLSRHPIDAIYVFHDPRDWGLDSQLMIDLLLTQHGHWGTRQLERQSMPVYFSNPDLLWANDNKYPRFGQGAFQVLIEGLYKAVTGRLLVSTTIGKPSRVTYEYAERVLATYQGLGAGSAVQGKVYMVGDNKASDIQGANDFGWESILVKTGVFDGTREEGCSGAVPAKYCVENVREAVEMVLSKEGII